MCTNLCIRAVGLALRQTGWGHTEMIKRPLRYALLNVWGIVLALFGSHGKHKTFAVISHSQANKMMKGKLEAFTEV